MYYNDRARIRITEGSASALDNLWRSLPKPLRPKFPMLFKVDAQSGYYDGEHLILSPEEVKQLKVEFDHILKVCAYEAFEPGLEVENFLKYWQSRVSWNDEEYFVESNKSTKELLDLANRENAWIMIVR
jgi:hypothetical protein